MSDFEVIEQTEIERLKQENEALRSSLAVVLAGLKKIAGPMERGLTGRKGLAEALLSRVEDETK